MFGKAASDLLGLSDVGSIISPKDFDKVDSDDYVMHEVGEKIYFLIKSKSDEYCFTNKALIHLDGTSAMSKKRALRRYDYHLHTISDVELETAGTVDLDVEIKFKIGAVSYSIDVHKKFLEGLKDLYKSLIAISQITYDNSVKLGYAQQSLSVASSTLSRSAAEDVHSQFQSVNEYAFQWLTDKKAEFDVRDFGYIFEKFIQE